MTTINPAFINLAQNYLATKERTPNYEIRSILWWGCICSGVNN